MEIFLNDILYNAIENRQVKCLAGDVVMLPCHVLRIERVTTGSLSMNDVIATTITTTITATITATTTTATTITTATTTTTTDMKTHCLQ